MLVRRACPASPTWSSGAPRAYGAGGPSAAGCGDGTERRGPRQRGFRLRHRCEVRNRNRAAGTRDSRADRPARRSPAGPRAAHPRMARCTSSIMAGRRRHPPVAPVAPGAPQAVPPAAAAADARRRPIPDPGAPFGGSQGLPVTASRSTSPSSPTSATSSSSGRSSPTCGCCSSRPAATRRPRSRSPRVADRPARRRRDGRAPGRSRASPDDDVLPRRPAGGGDEPRDGRVRTRTTRSSRWASRSPGPPPSTAT